MAVEATRDCLAGSERFVERNRLSTAAKRVPRIAFQLISMLVLTQRSIQEQDEVLQWHRPEGALKAAQITEASPTGFCVSCSRDRPPASAASRD